MQLNPADRVKQTLFSTIDSLFEDRDALLYNPHSDFTRTKKISFGKTMLYPMVAGSDNSAMELLNLFGEEDLPLPSAMIQRRNQVKPEAFRELFCRFIRRIPIRQTFRGYQIVSMDGSRLNLPYNPSDPDTFLQCIQGRKGINQMHLNSLYDPMNDIFLDVELQGIRQVDEKDAFCRILDRNARLDPGLPRRIYLADRGYAAYNIFAHAIHNQQLFLIRVSAAFAEGICKGREHWLEDASSDEEITVHIGRRKTKRNRKLENYHYIPTSRRYDFLDPGTDGTECLRLRVLKFPISEGPCEYIVTNLPSYAFSGDIIKKLYSLRWNEETAFRHLKYAGNMVRIHSLKKELVVQEIYGKLTLYNFSAFIAAVVGHCQKDTCRYTYVLNHTQVQKICIRFLQGTVQDVEALLSRFFVPVRPGRSFQRKLRRQSADTLAYR